MQGYSFEATANPTMMADGMEKMCVISDVRVCAATNGWIVKWCEEHRYPSGDVYSGYSTDYKYPEAVFSEKDEKKMLEFFKQQAIAAGELRKV